MKSEIKKYNKILVLASCKLNSIESTISKTLIDNEISNEYITTIINEEETVAN